MATVLGMGALFAGIAGTGAIVGYVCGMREAHRRYHAAKIVTQERLLMALRECQAKHLHLINAEYRAYRSLPIDPDCGDRTPTSFGAN